MHGLMLRDEQRKTAILMISLLSVIAILLMLWRNYLRQRRLYRNIVIANRDALAREQELLERLDVCAGSQSAALPHTAQQSAGDGGDSEPGAPDDSDNRLKNKTGSVFDSLQRLMERDEVYRDSNLTRERLAEMLGTNRTYLSQIIADHTGKGYYQFVNGYRIKEAIRVLSGAAGSDYPLKALAADLGFKSMTTFYKTFQEAVGMTPSAYRDTANSL